MEVIATKISDLHFAGYNPRTLSQTEFEELQRSIDTFGFLEPVVANKRGQVIVSGHQRVRAAQELQLDSVPVVWVDLDPQHEKALNIAMNAIGGEFDTDQLAELIAGLDDDLKDLTGFDPDEIAKLQDGWADVEALEREQKSQTDKLARWTFAELLAQAKLFVEQTGQGDVMAFLNWLNENS